MCILKVDVIKINVFVLSSGLQSSKAEKETVDRVVKQLDNAFFTVGFVFLINHGVDQNKVHHYANAINDVLIHVSYL